MVGSDEAKSAQRAVWGSGDYFVVSGHVQWVSEVLCESVQLRAEQHVLDLACGNGNTALAAARRGATVSAIDLTPRLLADAKQRAAAEHLDVEWHEGDLEALPFDDATFDVALSTFGIMFAPQPDVAVAEAARVLKPGGRLGVANWRSEADVHIAQARVLAKYALVTPDNPWTTENGVRSLLGREFSSVEIDSKLVHYRFPSATAYVQAFFDRCGPYMKIAEALEAAERASLQRDLAAEVEEHNASGDDSLDLPLDYLQVRAIRR